MPYNAELSGGAAVRLDDVLCGNTRNDNEG